MEEVIIKLELGLAEVNFIKQVLGELPTKSNAWILLNKINEQIDPQIPSQLQQPATPQE